MPSEQPTLSHALQQVMWESHRLSCRMGGDPELIDHYLLPLCAALLEAYHAGLARELIEKTLQDGTRHGALQLLDPSLTPEYWQTFYREQELSSRPDCI